MPRIYKSIDITGKTFNRLTAVKFSHRSEYSRQYWVFLCTCGNTKVLMKDKVVIGGTKSCGCLFSESLRKRSTTHGRAKKGDKTYASWRGLIYRVNHHPSNSYIGVTVSDEWRSFENFLQDMGERPEGKTIDRIDSEKGYCKENCRWATPLEQSRNRRKSFNRKTSSKYKGVDILKNKMWRAIIMTDEKSLYLGIFTTQEDAARAYNEAAVKYHGEFACLNPI